VTARIPQARLAEYAYPQICRRAALCIISLTLVVHIAISTTIKSYSQEIFTVAFIYSHQLPVA